MTKKNQENKTNKSKDELINKNNIRIILILIINNEISNLEKINYLTKFIDAIYICNYNSNNNIDEYLKTIEIPIKISNDMWKNSEYNQNINFISTIKFCEELNWQKDTTYGLFLNMNQQLIISPKFNKQNLTADAYNLKLKTDMSVYDFPKLLNLGISWICKGTINEYWYNSKKESEIVNLEENKIYIDDKNMIKIVNSNDVKIILILMIKNESKIIERALKSVEEFVDAMCICDTGSTDNTVEIIKKYFKTIKKPTRLCNHKWENFGHNRSLSFNETVKFCQDIKWNTSKTYGLLLDADQKLVIKDEFNRNTLDESGYSFLIKSWELLYYVPKLINLSKNWKCIGSTHEYWIDSDDIDGPADLDELYIEDVGDGGCKSDKYERDIRLLMKDLTTEIYERTGKNIIDEEEIFKNLHTNNSRTLYYLGQSYFDTDKSEDAIKWLSKRILFKDNEDEVYSARLKIGISLSKLDRPESEIK